MSVVPELLLSGTGEEGEAAESAGVREAADAVSAVSGRLPEAEVFAEALDSETGTACSKRPGSDRGF